MRKAHVLSTQDVYFRIFILQVFKENIEKPEQTGGPILGIQEIKTIFGSIPPIYDVHLKIRDNLCEILKDWKDECLVGNIVLDHVCTYVDFPAKQSIS